ncbi:MAG: hypothetical protein IJ530_00950 [Treponema sp.]|uniref:hypothetical protein n=1 Tax=Treponema sp. TaxID=166 RepID=UPI0025EAAB34|nr:hypothetical protein [Treponema sp.]MBQ8678312.1 hypothetical protein [Treponema sp.]
MDSEEFSLAISTPLILFFLFVPGIFVFKILDARDSENYAYTIRTGILRTYHTDDYTLDDDTLEFTDESGTKHTIRSGSFEITENKKNTKKTEEEQNK